MSDFTDSLSPSDSGFLNAFAEFLRNVPLPPPKEAPERLEDGGSPASFTAAPDDEAIDRLLREPPLPRGLVARLKRTLP